MKQLNRQTSKVELEVQFGKSPHFLDECIYVEENKIHYCGYNKPKDAKRYLNPSSFHPRSVFDSVPCLELFETTEKTTQKRMN